jgi:hypothetical protein
MVQGSILPPLYDKLIEYPTEKNNLSASCERVAGRPTAAILDASQDGAIAGALVETFDKRAGGSLYPNREAAPRPGEGSGKPCHLVFGLLFPDT